MVLEDQDWLRMKALALWHSNQNKDWVKHGATQICFPTSLFFAVDARQHFCLPPSFCGPIYFSSVRAPLQSSAQSHSVVGNVETVHLLHMCSSPPTFHIRAYECCRTLVLRLTRPWRDIFAKAVKGWTIWRQHFDRWTPSKLSLEDRTFVLGKLSLISTWSGATGTNWR